MLNEHNCLGFALPTDYGLTMSTPVAHQIKRQLHSLDQFTELPLRLKMILHISAPARVPKRGAALLLGH